MKLEGLLVDLVPLGKRYEDLEHRWENSEAAFWGDMGDRQVITRKAIQQRQEERHGWRDHNANPAIPFGIQTKDGTPIGFFYIAGLEMHHRHALYGAMICEKEYWGGGYGTDALLLVTDYAFDWLDLHKVWLITMSYNQRVVRQMEKVGFALEVRRRAATIVDGARHDVLMYGMLREEWPGREALVEKLGLKTK